MMKNGKISVWLIGNDLREFFFFVLFPAVFNIVCAFSYLVPPFNVTISKSYYDPLYAGTNLTITCNITLSNLVDIPVIVSSEWTRNGSEITETTITEDLVKINNLNYIASLEFFPLNALTDNREYKCSVRVIPSVLDEDDYMYIINITNNASTALDVLGEFVVGLVKITVTAIQYCTNTELSKTKKVN